MTQWDASSDEHAQFRELAAAVTSGTLTSDETESLGRHLRVCEECSLVLREYRILAREGFAFLARNQDHREEGPSWNEAAARRRLLARVRESKESSASGFSRVRRFPVRKLVLPASLAACLLAGVGIGAWQYGGRALKSTPSDEASVTGQFANLLSAKRSAESALAMKAEDLAHLQADEVQKRRAFDDIQNRYRVLEAKLATARAGMDDLSQAKARTETQLNQVSLERDELSEQLRSTRQAYELIQTELERTRAERDKARLETASLEAHVEELTALGHEQEHRLKANEQYLASDRDIRDLMSARNLYIADVFDVDSHSRTRKPFGRVFFTRGKSLLFYAFDLDQPPQLKDSSTFQVWGERETDQNDIARPVDLGILYLDSEANRRWFLRFDDPRTLSEIDAVFVTVEPHGGSRKPTGKPFLFATLRKEPNHP